MRLVFVLMAIPLFACSQQPPTKTQAPPPQGWLMSAESDEARFAGIERQFRGFETTMWETGERHRALREALERGNYDLALYHWDKIKTAINSGLERRPVRRANGEALFLVHWQEVREDFASRDSVRAWAGFERATAACQSCHVAERVGYINDQPLFEERRTSLP